MKSIVTALVPIFFLLLCPESASACWCRREPLDTEKKFRAAVAKELRRSALVFSGEAVAEGMFGLRFRVETVWKGKVTDEVVFTYGMYAEPSAPGDEVFIDSCARTFEMGRRYLVYALEVGELFVSKCSRTQNLESAERDMNELNRLKPKPRVQSPRSAIRPSHSRSTSKSNNGVQRTRN